MSLCQVIKKFKRQGEIQTPGEIIDVPEGAIPEFNEYLKPIALADNHPSCFPVFQFSATYRGPSNCNTENNFTHREIDKFRVQDVFQGDWPGGRLTPEIIKQTEHNLPLQAKLLRQHCPERFTGEGWLAIIRQWIERARTLFEDQHMGLHEANWQAATEMNLLAFADELLLKKAQPT